MLSCADYSSVTLNSLVRQGLQRADYSSVTRNHLHSKQFCRIACFQSGAAVRAARALPTRDHWRELIRIIVATVIC